MTLAKKAHALNKEDGYALATLALALHFKGDLHQRDELMKMATKDSALSYYFTYVTDVITGKESLRN